MLVFSSGLTALQPCIALILNQHYILMEKAAFLYLLFFITFLSLLGISTPSPCNTTDECRTNSNIPFFCCDNTCQLRSKCRFNGSSGTIPSSSNPNSNFTANSTSEHDSVKTNPSHTPCAKDEQCNFPNTICISLECSSRNPDSLAACERCESIACKDGRCYNSSVQPTTVATKGTITTLQLVLLFGSMGGILIFIIIVYCVKTFTDNRQRQYLLKYGVWDNPPNKDAAKNEDGETKSDSSRQQRKLEVPTITVETETAPKKKKKKKENSKDEITDTEGLEEFAVQQEQDNQAKVKAIADEGNPEENHSMKTPHSQIGQTIASPKNNTIPTGWDNVNEFTPLTESPRQKRFGNFMKSNENSPTKMIPNGTPEKSPIFSRQKKASPPVKLCEPENFSDYGM